MTDPPSPAEGPRISIASPNVIGDGNVVDVRVSMASGLEGLTRDERLQALRNRSDHRIKARLVAAGLTEAHFEAALAEVSLPPRVAALGAGECIVLTGPLGSGKSEAAEVWHRRGIEAWAADAGTPVPVWISARARSDLYAAACEQAGGETVLARTGIDLVVDGLDETSPATAALLASAAEELVATWPKCRAVCTARDGLVRDGIATPMPALEDREALNLIQQLSGSDHPVGYQWSPALLETVRRPLFALLMAGRISRGETANGRAELLDGLVQDALKSKGYLETGISEARLFELLRTCAARATDRGQPLALSEVGTAQEQEALRRTWLVDVAGGRVVFPVPVVEQWLAAQAIVAGDVVAGPIVSDVGAFARWRYPIAIAVGIGPADLAHSLIGQLAEWNPGAAGWTLQNAVVDDHLSIRTEEHQSLDADDAGTAIRRSMTSWTEGLGPLRDYVAPIRGDGGLLPLGINAQGRHLTTSWAWRNPSLPDVGRIAGDEHPFSAPPSNTPWSGFRMAHAATTDLWPWLWTHAELVRELDPLVNGHPPVELGEGVIGREAVYWMCRVLAGNAGSLLHTPIRIDDLLTRMAALVNPDGTSKYAMYALGSRRLTGRDLEELYVWLRSQTHISQVERPYPGPDRLDARGGFIWNIYSPARFRDLAAAVLDAALRAYGELTDPNGGLFACFGKTLGLAAAGPVRIEGLLRYEDPADKFETGPDLSYVVLPASSDLHTTRESAAECGSALVDFTDGHGALWDRSFGERYWGEVQQLIAARDDQAFVQLPNGGFDDLYFSRPATALALKWLYHDLKAVGWTKAMHTFDGHD